MDDYVNVNRKLTAKLIKEGHSKGTFKRHEKIANVVSKWADKSKPLLEIGVREGYLFDHLKKYGFKYLYGVDISPEAIQILHERGYDGEINDAMNLTIEQNYGTIIMSHCLEHCPQPKKVVNGAYRLLELYGILYVEVPQQHKEPVPTKWGHYYCFENFDDLLSFFPHEWTLEWSEIQNKNLRGIFRKVA
jgi:SAM-dependent methyltransferase